MSGSSYLIMPSSSFNEVSSNSFTGPRTSPLPARLTETMQPDLPEIRLFDLPVGIRGALWRVIRPFSGNAHFER
jgi:hypothetical protein